MSNQHPYDRSMEKTREVNRMRGLLREAADLIERDHRWIPLLDDALVCDGCGAARYPCRYEQLRRRIEEALNG